jgi:tungstate transport system ATP-binding protein
MTTPAQTLLHITALDKSFGNHALLKIRDLQLHSASAYVLTGMNGAGKSVFLRILAGLEKPDHAQCHYRGLAVDLHSYPDHLRSSIVYVHQHPIMLTMTVEKNIAYGLRMRGLPAGEIADKTEQIMRWAHLLHLRHRAPHGLSGGEKQKIALARAKVVQPALLLLDEPTANLDGQAREQVIALIPSLVAEGMTVVMACHDRDLIHIPDVHRLKLRDGAIEHRGIHQDILKE